ncbi:hypothetical protein [Sphingobacterium sp. BIGb0165]|uniref:hypothetical protein n=1 Tax=Sphingobacterium sp. BIGb0165 TaxID=2940615 RepID=UPI002167AF49|nr:hypothetical protein [Sphingobacterium sp. BIGb0165]MCS4226396.1 hypothetical protein [Sphingobacterium sp. BIGb0165]
MQRISGRHLGFFPMLLAFIFILGACGHVTPRKTGDNSAGIPKKDSVKAGSKDRVGNTAIKDKVSINFTQHKTLLDLILLLPDDAFSSWEWKPEDRLKWYNEIKANNFYSDATSRFSKQKYFEPDRAGFMIVDGFWSINLYHAADGSTIVITDDHVGDGHTLNFYEVRSNKLKAYMDGESMLSGFRETLKKTDPVEPCSEKFEELEDPIFEYDFSKNDKIEIESSWYLAQESYGNCLNGNAIQYRFNPQTKKFDIEKIYWKPKQSE